ncbi:MAG TPA: Crp/Fnr family transcriptional regulator [Gammaproteobacteria bacterium]|nr:Crp/Fnr family transcriptional regulator [Gammaproteobacteria bacterium]
MPPVCKSIDGNGRSPDRQAAEPDSHIRELASVYPDFVEQCDARALELLKQTERFQCPAGTVMFHEQDPCRNFIWLLQGSVRIYKHSADGREVTLYRVEPGDLCVLSLNALLGNRAYPAEAVAETAISGLVLNGDIFLQGIRESDSFRNYVLKTLTERLHDMMTLVSDIAFHRLDLRLACLLGQRFERSQGETLNVTHAELARELGTTREVVSRILKEFEHQQCVRLSRGRIRLVSQQGLDWFTRQD